MPKKLENTDYYILKVTQSATVHNSLYEKMKAFTQSLNTFKNHIAEEKLDMELSKINEKAYLSLKVNTHGKESITN